MLSLPLFIEPISFTLLIVAIIYLCVRDSVRPAQYNSTKQRATYVAADYGANRVVNAAKYSILGSFQVLLTTMRYVMPFIQRTQSYQEWSQYVNQVLQYTPAPTTTTSANAQARASTSSANVRPPTYSESFNDPSLPQNR